MLILLSLIAADAATMMKVADARSPVVAEPAAPRRSPYRLDPNVAGPADGKAAAVATTGGQCAITGPTLCTRKPRTLYAARY